MGGVLKMETKMLLLICLVTVVLSPEPVRSLNPSFNDDVLGLIVFKADIEDPKGKLASWNEDDDSPCSNWAGVTCNPRSNRVAELNLDGFSLSGRIGRGLFQLEFLRKLSLAGNNLSGTITPNFARLESLRVVDLSNNGLSGALPDNFFRQCGSLRAFSLAKNKFSGKIPGSLSSCSSIAALNLSSNQFSGSVPSGVWSLSSLRLLDLSDNRLEGQVSDAIGGMMNLRTISLQKNRFSGKVPDAIGACSLLRSIDLSENSISGYLPETMRKLSLCSYLNLRRNSFSGELPLWITEMKSVESLDVSSNAFSGQVPPSIGSLRSLKSMNFSTNNFTGSLPESLSSIAGLVSFDFSRNYLTGDLPSWIFRSDLRVLDLSDNAFTGTIPSSVGDMKVLDVLNLGQNKLSGSIPFEIGGASSLTELRLEKNFLGGKIPTSIENCSSLTTLLEKNFLGGKIPTSIENCSSLTAFIVSENNLTGPIPAEMGKLSGLQNVDLSTNSLAGPLPRQLANLPHLVTFNISHNHLAGELPAGGFFNTISPYSVAGNPSLCGAAVDKSCPTIMPKPIVLNPNTTPDSDSGETQPDVGHKRIILSISALVAIGAAALIITGVIAITVLNLRVRSSTTTRSAMALTFSAGGDDDFTNSPITDANSGKLVMFSGDPDFSTGAHALLNKDCELGRGGFGAVYRTVLRDGRAVAIKKLTVSSLVKSQDDFEREVKKLGRVKHDNLVSLEGYYWTQSLQLLIYEFVPGGSLYKHLHEGLGGNYLSWNERLNIIIGAAKSLAHLHQSKIIHYNIKSSNVLIDGAGEAKLADFGLARLLPMLDRYVLSSKIQSALGYMAPEFACRTVKITEKCDVYGFGVLVLEVVTGKRPVEYMEDDVVVLCDMVRGALEEGRVEDCVDLKLQGKFPAEEAVPVMKLGLICTSQVPSNRPEMSEVVNILELIRCPSDESGSG